MSRTTTLVAREHEHERALHSLRFSGGVLITGPAGVGKTALAAAIAERLPTPPVSWLVATAAGRTTPLGLLSRMLPADLGSIHPALVAQHVDTRIRELQRTGGRSSAPPVLVVDDAQLLDTQTAAILLALVSAKSVRLLGTMRTGGDPSDAVTALWKEDLVDRLDLGPLDRTGTRDLLEQLLDGPVAAGTVETLWTSSGGNPLYLTELARYGAARGQLSRSAGVWWWTGPGSQGAPSGTGMPPRLGELLRGRIDALSDSAREAVEFLALGEPLPYDTLAALVDERVILELDRAEMIVSDDREGVLLLRFAHPLLQAVAEHGISGTWRRALCQRLRRAPAEHVDVVRRATWEEAAGGRPNLDVLLAAAEAVMLNDPAAAERFASRAYAHSPSVATATALAAVHSELNRPDRARALLEETRELAQTEAEVAAHGFEELSLAMWGERRPDRARDVLARLRRVLPAEWGPDLDSSEALLLLFTGQCLGALPPARSALLHPVSPRTRIRALICLTGALAFADRGAEAIATGRELLDALAEARVHATQAGLGYALIAVTGLFFGVAYHLPRPMGSSGRWPALPAVPTGAQVSPLAPPGAADVDTEIGWPLLVGLRRHFRGDLAGALGPLREAYVQQRAGEGLFRSEATAELVVVLAELGQVDEAAALLADCPPDDIAIIPGLGPWAQAAVDAADGRPGPATEHALEGARIAAAAGAYGMAMNFLTDAGRYGDPRMAAAALPSLGVPLTSDLQRVRAADVLARASGDPQALLAAAEAQLAAGFFRHAHELAEMAQSVDDGSRGRPLAAILRQARERLGPVSSAAARPPGPLTARESEVARLAGRGRTDREIAEELVLSVRTVQSHLASAYRKLGITSRTELAALRI